MKYLMAACSDVGIKKSTNQDSLFIKLAETEYGQVCFAVLCDGMGGLAKGEVASATVVRHFADWFEKEFPKMLYRGIDPGELRRTWDNLIREVNDKIAYYSEHNNAKMGSTVVALLTVGEIFYIVNVGDSRAYRITGSEISLLTKDQTFVQREMDEGRMTCREAEQDARRSVLLQCVGASEVIDPDFYQGEITEHSVFMLCSDGFRHVVGEAEMKEKLNPGSMPDEETMERNARFLVELNKFRREEDNISVALVQVYR